ncbi:MAG: gas vesicle protein, partial [Polaribacter sp.]
MSNSSNTVVGLLAGTVIGATLGILFAPEKGIVTRHKISDEAIAAKDMFSEKASEKASEIKNQVTSNVSSSKESLDTQLENVVSNVSHKAEDVIS